MNRALLTIGLAAMHVCWLYAWSLMLVRWVQSDPAQPLLSAASMFVLVVLAAFTARLVIRQLGSGRNGQLALIGTGVVAALGAVRVSQYGDAGALDWLGPLAGATLALLGRPTLPALALVLGLLLWWRGVQLGSSSPSFQDVESAFRWNIGALIAFSLALAIATRPSQQPLLEAQATPYVVGAFFVGLLTLALGRLESLRSSNRALALNSQWLGVLIGVAGLLVLAALALAQALSFDLLILATRPIFDLLGQVLVILLYIIVIPLAYVIEWLLYWLLSLISPNANPQPPEPVSPDDVNTFLQRLLGQGLPHDIVEALKALGAVLVLAAALLLVARTVARWRPRADDTDPTLEERDSIFEPGRLRAALLAWLRRLFRRERTAPAALAPVPATDTREARAALTSVRELYRRVLALGEAAGSPRAAPTTPLEHLPALAHTLEPAEDLARLTDAYLQVRYAEDEPDAANLEQLKERTERVQPR